MTKQKPDRTCETLAALSASFSDCAEKTQAPGLKKTLADTARILTAMETAYENGDPKGFSNARKAFLIARAEAVKQPSVGGLYSDAAELIDLLPKPAQKAKTRDSSPPVPQ